MQLPHPRTGALFDSPVPPGSGWPGDPATPETVVATTPAQVAARAGTVAGLARLHAQTDRLDAGLDRLDAQMDRLDAEVSVCRACPRLVRWREEVAVVKRRSFADQPYWGRPVAGWGAARPRVLIVGLAPAAHGGNRTGRVFTGDRSADFLIASMHRSGLASQPTSVDAADGLTLISARMVAPVRCAPPDNAPTPEERRTCEPWLDAEWRLIADDVRVVVALGGFAWKAALAMGGRAGGGSRRGPAPVFAHGATARLDGGATLIGSYHPSQQNTFTGRLTPQMLDDVFGTARALAGL